MYLKQMMHSMSHNPVIPCRPSWCSTKKVEGLFIYRTADGTIIICFNVRFKEPGKAKRQDSPEGAVSQHTERQTESDRLKQQHEAKQRQEGQ